MSAPIANLSEFYERHHANARSNGAFVFVPERIPFFKKALGAPGKRILDLGCRSGAVARHFVEGNEVVGLDVDRNALQAAEKLGIETVVADVEAPLPFPDMSFDAVVAGELLEHVRFPENVVAEGRRLLRPGGIFVGSVPNMFNLHNAWPFSVGSGPIPTRRTFTCSRPTPCPVCSRNSTMCTWSSSADGSSGSTGACSPGTSRSAPGAAGRPGL
jgi:SAM-dependent methyltransferase